jgi:NAD+ kinase
MKFLIFVNGQKSEAVQLGRRLAARWDAAGELWAAAAEDSSVLEMESTASFAAGDTGWTGVVLGGDGTLLRAVRTDPRLPFLAVNFGTVGFLSAFEPDEVDSALDDLAAGDLVEDHRLMLSVSVDGGPESPAVNEIVVGRRFSRRTATVRAEVDGEPLWSWPSDGVLVATPTGSTAYALSAGGPLVVPGADVLLLVPVCPHSLFDRAVVLPADCTVRLMPDNGTGDDLAATADGVTLAEGPISEVVIRRADTPLRLLARPKGRYSRLRKKLIAWSVQGGQG